MFHFLFVRYQFIVLLAISSVGMADKS